MDEIIAHFHRFSEKFLDLLLAEIDKSVSYPRKRIFLHVSRKKKREQSL